jgi:hypothetical protein
MASSSLTSPSVNVAIYTIGQSVGGSVDALQ